MSQYWGIFQPEYQQLMARKLGFDNSSETSAELLKRLLEQMQQSRTDYTQLFRELCNIERDSDARHIALRDMFVARESFDRWLNDYRVALRQHGKNDETRQAEMKRINPKYVLRNYMAQIAIEKAEREKDYSEIDNLMRILQNPFDEHPQFEHYAGPPPEWAEEIAVSCSS